jgi:hypothetical protein
MTIPRSGDPDLYGNGDLENEHAGGAVPGLLPHDGTSAYSVPNSR